MGEAIRCIDGVVPSILCTALSAVMVLAWAKPIRCIDGVVPSILCTTLILGGTAMISYDISKIMKLVCERRRKHGGCI